MKKIFLICSMALVVVGCGHDGKQTLKFSGTLELNEHALGAKASGKVSTLLVDEGDSVKKGQILATLDRYQQAQKDLNRIQQLYKQGGATQQELEYASLALEDQRVEAPVDGVVLVKVHDVGEMVSAGLPIVVVGDRRQLWVRIYVPEGVVNQIRLQQPVRFSFDGIKQSFSGHVSFVASQAEFTPRNVQTAEERITQTFAVKAVVDQAPDFLRPGVAADVEIQVGGSRG